MASMTTDYTGEQNGKNWMRTYGGGQFFPFDPKIEDINIQAIAHHLAMEVRYGGGPRDYYSVAEHCVLISEALERDGYPYKVCLDGLLHDAAEFVMGDTPRPRKNALREKFPAAAGFLKNAEDAISKLVAEKFNLNWPLPEAVHEYDRRIIKDEIATLFDAAPWSYVAEPLRVQINCWDWHHAKRYFLRRFEYLQEAIAENLSNNEHRIDVV
jgi:hypothetical protein